MKIPPLLVNNKYILNCKQKADEFAPFFSSQCKHISNDRTLPNDLTNKKLDHIPFDIDKILIRRDEIYIFHLLMK